MIGVEDPDGYADAAEAAAAAAADIAAIDMDSAEVQDASLKIQAGFRGMKARQEVKSKKSEPKRQQAHHAVGPIGSQQAMNAKFSAALPLRRRL